MARELRVEFAGARYHVINRSNYRKDLFTGQGAAASFQHCLGEAVARFGWRVHAFVVMRNHCHLTLETPEPNLTTTVGALGARFAALPSQQPAPQELQLAARMRASSSAFNRWLADRRRWVRQAM